MQFRVINLTVRYDTSESEKMHQRASSVMPGGVSGDVKYRRPYPLFLRSASGSHVFDVNGNEYIDYALSYGALILGHGHSVVKEAINQTMADAGTLLFGNPSPDEVEFGQLLLQLFMENGRIRFTNSGLESTLLAIRLAMASTGRRKIAKFDGHYHGANPLALINYKPKNLSRNQYGQIIKEADSAEIVGDLFEDSVVLPFNDIEGTKQILEETDPAAVIMEPFEDGYIPADPKFLHFLRDYTKEKGIVLIFDEVKTGVRIRMGGATEFYGVKPDLICLGKIIGGGTPVGAVVGSKELMDHLDPQSGKKKVFHSGTLVGNPLGMRVGLATINELLRDNNFEKIMHMNESLKKILSESLDDFGVQHTMYGEGGVVNFVMGQDEIRTHRDISPEAHAFRRRVDAELLGTGIYSVPDTRFSLCLSHTDDDFEKTETLFKNAVKKALENDGSITQESSQVGP